MLLKGVRDVLCCPVRPRLGSCCSDSVSAARLKFTDDAVMAFFGDGVGGAL
jgi:hypothetical protein